ncbi:MAG: hypothetical protein KDD47_01840 [Acidobacteria bacterium]|nr:hypothetical protein [Acidobacteriota bacterium]
MSRGLLLSFLGLSSFLMLGCLFRGGEGAAVVFGVLAILFPVALMALGGWRRGRMGRGGAGLSALAAVLLGSFWGLLSLRGQVLEGPWIFGLPASVVILLGGFWLLPWILVSLTYGLTFSQGRPGEKELDRLLEAARRQPEAQGEEGES